MQNRRKKSFGTSIKFAVSLMVSQLLILFGNIGFVDADCVDDFSPCFCNEDLTLGQNVICFKVPFDEVKKAFEGNEDIRDLNRFDVVPAPGEDLLPLNLLGQHRARIIYLATCPSQIQIDEDAFKSSAEYTQEFMVVDCDVNLLDWTFLKGFTRLERLQLNDDKNIQSLANLPSLPSVKTLYISNCAGLIGLSPGFPGLQLNGLNNLILTENLELDDRLIEFIFSSLTTAPDLKFVSLRKSPQITKVPDNLVDLPAVHSLDLFQCSEIKVISSESLTFSSLAVQLVDLSQGSLQTVLEGAFENAFYGEAKINLDDNRLDRLQSSVYYKPLNDMMSSISGAQGNISIEANPIQCDDCGFAWLIRDVPQLLPFVSGTCSNSTRFQDLNPSWYDDQNCDVFTTTTLPPSTTLTDESSSFSTEESTLVSATSSEGEITETSDTTEEEITTTSRSTSSRTTTRNPLTSTRSTESVISSTTSTAEQPSSGENYDTLFYILYGVLGAIALILICGFIYLGAIRKRNNRELLEETNRMTPRSLIEANPPQRMPNVRIPETRPPVIVEIGQLKNETVKRGSAPIITPYMTNGYTPSPGRVRGLRRVNF